MIISKGIGDINTDIANALTNAWYLYYGHGEPTTPANQGISLADWNNQYLLQQGFTQAQINSQQSQPGINNETSQLTGATAAPTIPFATIEGGPNGVITNPYLNNLYSPNTPTTTVEDAIAAAGVTGNYGIQKVAQNQSPTPLPAAPPVFIQTPIGTAVNPTQSNSTNTNASSVIGANANIPIASNGEPAVSSQTNYSTNSGVSNNAATSTNQTLSDLINSYLPSTISNPLTETSIAGIPNYWWLIGGVGLLFFIGSSSKRR